MKRTIREAVECADADALLWIKSGSDFPTHWAIRGPSPWRDGGVKIDPDGALERGLIGLRHNASSTRVYVTKAGRALLAEDTA